MSENAIFNIVEGLSRPARLPQSLNPEYFKIDERQTDDFLEFAIRLAPSFNYYNFNNEVDGDWQGFFDSDVDTLITLLSKSNLKGSIRQFEEISVAIHDAEDDITLTAALNDAFALLYQVALVLQKFSTKLNLAKNRNTDTISIFNISDSCNQEINRFISDYTFARRTFSGIKALDLTCFNASASKVLAAPEEAGHFKKSPEISRQIEDIKVWFSSAFSDGRKKLGALISASAYYCKHTSWNNKAHDPHMGLFVTFLKLYSYLQEEINGLTARHLDYYYNNILGIPVKAAIPDKVHLIFQLAANVKQLQLNAGELLEIQVPGLKQKVFYKTNNDVVISQAQVKELKTQYVSQAKQIYRNNNTSNSVREFRIYSGNYPVIKSADFESRKKDLVPWPLLGEEQNDLPDGERTMNNAATGVIVASPVFYARDGKRRLQVRFYITAASSFLLDEYIKTLATATSYQENDLIHMLLEKALVINITGDTGWIPVSNFNLRFSDDTADKFIELTLVLTGDELPVGLYNPAIHGGTYDVSSPALKLMLNDNTFHRPYGFLKKIILERITVKTKVTGSKNIRIKNNLGPVTNTSPFQLFGPFPLVGSYLDINNSNIFNQYLKTLSINIEWFDLPKEIGGFDTYFKGYGNDIKNESFKVVVGGVSNDHRVRDVKQQKDFFLFETVRDDTSQVFLNEETILKNIDCPGLGFTNTFKAAGITSLSKEEGVRIELTSPNDGFGQRVYPLILPGIIARNAKKSKKNFVLPNLPYIPVVKSIDIDYTLEHTKIPRNNRGVTNDDLISLIHVQPFGYESVYPGKGGTDIYLVPQFSEGSSLFIGIENLVPNQELSILFQLEQMTFHHTAHEEINFTWSYLQNNTWINFVPKDILSDTTNNFLSSGIVSLKIPDYDELNNSILNPVLYWIRASSPQNSTAGATVVGIFTQACVALQDFDVSSSVPAIEILPPGSVKGFTKKVPEITKVYQFFASGNGRRGELKTEHRLRVSERLRHKNRALTALDISQLVLENFPQILMVKCFNRSMSATLILPGIDFQVIVIPKLNDIGYVQNKEPHVNLATLLLIQQLLGSRLRSFAKFAVGNPVYEKIKVICTVGLKRDKVNFNETYYINLLNNDIKKFITPWLFDNKSPVKIAGKIYLSDILDYLKKLSYIDFVSGFSMLHFFQRFNAQTGTYNAMVTDSAVEKISFLEASRHDAILFSSSNHIINIVAGNSYSDPLRAGIGNLEVGAELTVYAVSENTRPSTHKDDLTGNEDDLEFIFDF